MGGRFSLLLEHPQSLFQLISWCLGLALVCWLFRDACLLDSLALCDAQQSVILSVMLSTCKQCGQAVMKKISPKVNCSFLPNQNTKLSDGSWVISGSVLDFIGDWLPNLLSFSVYQSSPVGSTVLPCGADILVVAQQLI